MEKVFTVNHVAQATKCFEFISKVSKFEVVKVDRDYNQVEFWLDGKMYWAFHLIDGIKIVNLLNHNYGLKISV